VTSVFSSLPFRAKKRGWQKNKSQEESRVERLKKKHKIGKTANTLQSSEAGLPDGIFSNQKFKFGKFFEGLAMEDAGIFYGH
jgi:hypothetical protein